MGGILGATCYAENTGDKPRNPNYMASPYVRHRQLDLSSFTASDRFGLHAIQHTRDASLDAHGVCRMVEEAGDKLQNDGTEGGEAVKIYRTLTNEFATEINRWTEPPTLAHV